ncbi:hypothetical protein HELRODRAFT_168117 [Helobdella robusta]|uniref:UBA domain-containing protein n=1 Tax=Helobdella robusta TaxID=6412 RepID=T1F066_HELRO|nr:hypothetical protein HELRODRAFT_168117 [Helobdella robusta]ESO10231.1 hypothetical protein HELRODRAFT_168117 [Helobdella robusta]
MANFTGIDDVEKCLSILEQFEWNLEEAVQHALEDSFNLPSAQYSGEANMSSDNHNLLSNASHLSDVLANNPFSNLINIEPADFFHSSNTLFSNDPSSEVSHERFNLPSRLLNFDVEYRNEIHIAKVFDNKTVGSDGRRNCNNMQGSETKLNK